MKIISELSDMIEEETNDAEKYIRAAMNTREDYPDLSAAFYRLSTEEMVHMKILHDQVVAIINDYRKTNGEPPAKMQAIYDYLHDKHIKKANEVRIMQALYKG